MSLRSRREFLRDSAALAALGGSGLLHAPLSAAMPDEKVVAKGANDTLNVAIIGVHGRGRDHVHGLAGRAGINVAVIATPTRP